METPRYSDEVLRMDHELAEAVKAIAEAQALPPSPESELSLRDLHRRRVEAEIRAKQARLPLADQESQHQLETEIAELTLQLSPP